MWNSHVQMFNISVSRWNSNDLSNRDLKPIIMGTAEFYVNIIINEVELTCSQPKCQPQISNSEVT